MKNPNISQKPRTDPQHDELHKENIPTNKKGKNILSGPRVITSKSNKNLSNMNFLKWQ
jgi:hypothetical protein